MPDKIFIVSERGEAWNEKKSKVPIGKYNTRYL